MYISIYIYVCICAYDCMYTLEIIPEITWKYILVCKLFGLYNIIYDRKYIYEIYMHIYFIYIYIYIYI